MLRLFTPVLLLEAFCIYHAYSNNAHQKWFFLIFFLPGLGSLIYLYVHFLTDENTENLTEEVKGMMNENYEKEKLERESRLSDTVANKTKLADEYFKKGLYQDAIELYESCLEGFNTNDPHTMTKLVDAYYMLENYELAVEFGDRLESDRHFNRSDEKVSYAWSLYFIGEIEKARYCFESMNKRFSNYFHRMEYSLFLSKIDETDKARELLGELLDEFNDMDNREQRNKRGLKRSIENLYNDL